MTLLLPERALRDFRAFMARNPELQPRGPKHSSRGACDEAPANENRRRFFSKLAEMNDQDFEKSWSRFLDFLLGRNDGESSAEDNGEGFESPMARELARMDDPRNLSPELDAPRPGPKRFEGRPSVTGAADSRLAFDRRETFGRVRADDGKARGQVFAAAGMKIDHRAITDLMDRRAQ